MRSIKIAATTEEPVEEFWDLIIDVPNWNHLIKFVKYIKVFGKVEEGVKFFDITSILWIPTPIIHKISKIEKYKNFEMEAYLPLRSGKMFQTIQLSKKGKVTTVEIEIKFYISFFLFDKLFGPILEIRLKEMLKNTLLKLKEKLDNKNRQLGIKRISEIINE